MRPAIPGARLHKMLARLAPESLMREVLEPAIADLQYEVEHAATPRHRKRAILQGHFAVLRALGCSIDSLSALRAALAVAALTTAGAFFVASALAGNVEGRIRISAFLAPVLLAPFVLRLQGVSSAGGLFLGGLVVSLLTPVVAGRLEAETTETVWSLTQHTLGLLVLFVPTAAAAALVAEPRNRTPIGRATVAVSLGSGVTTTLVLVIRWLDGHFLVSDLALAPFYVVLFAGLFTLTIIPPLLVVRPFLRSATVLAAAGLMASPAPWMAVTYVDHGTLASCLDTLGRAPISFVVSSLPVVLGSVAIGWRFPSRRDAEAPSAGPSQRVHRQMGVS